MENEAPKYASWIPEAGGYVANGKVVSKSPIYENGKFKLDVDTSVFGNTQPQKTVQQTGMQTLNTQGSGTDVNWGMTGAGSLGSLTQNTAKTGSAISTPAIQSPLITSKPVDALEQINQRYLDAVARNDYKAMIDALVEASNADGVDRTTQINELCKQRGEKVRNIDNAYLQRLSQATTPEEYNQILGEQQAWRNSVGYADQINKDYQMQEQEIQLDYESTWNQTINDISNALTQMLPEILNFQYDPYTDPALNIAQGYAVGKVKETMNATGMYDSSMTQRAITKAVAELVPVYEKMAKEEAQQNFQLLQSTASYLMNLDKYQFDMWKSQIEMRWKQDDQKQKAIDNAINNANARGYYTNEEAMLLGIPAGTESSEARKRAQEKQDKLEEDLRKHQQDIELAQIKEQLEEQKLEKEYKLKNQYGDSEVKYQYTFDENGNQKLQVTSNKPLNQVNGNYVTDTGDVIAPVQQSGGENVDIDFNKNPGGTNTVTETKNNLADSATQDTFTKGNLAQMFKDAWDGSKKLDDAYNAIKQASTKIDGENVNIFDTELLDSLGSDKAERMKNYYEYLKALEIVELDPDQNIFELFNSEDVPSARRDKYANAYIKNYLFDDIEFNDNESHNKSEMDRAMGYIDAGVPYMNKEQIIKSYETLFDEVLDAGSKAKPFDFDKSQLIFNNKENSIVGINNAFDNVDEYFSINDAGDKSKQLAIVYAINKVAGRGNEKSAVNGHPDQTYISSKLAKYLYDKAQDMEGYTGLKNEDNYTITW